MGVVFYSGSAADSLLPAALVVILQVWVFLHCGPNLKGVLADSEILTVSACNLSNQSGPSPVCECSASQVLCGARQPKLTAVPMDFITSIQVLDLSKNAITAVKDNSFVGLASLRTLFLQDNLISSIEPSAFRNLFNLSILNLEQNKLQVLDPTQIMFQHLPTLTLLNFQNNQIERIKKLSFLTAGSAGSKLVIKFYGNPVECNCDVYALRNWLRTVTDRNITIDQLRCQNDPMNRPYNEMTTDYLFSQCTEIRLDVNSRRSQSAAVPAAANQNIALVKRDIQKRARAIQSFLGLQRRRFRDGRRNPGEDDEDRVASRDTVMDNGDYPCPVCNNVRTNFACRLEPKVQCRDPQNMCQTKFVWDNLDKSMSITSGCNSYSNCLLQEASNSRTCLINYQAQINCSFCCRGPTCVDNTIGGRTKDLEFMVTYVLAKSSLNPAEMNDKTSQTFKNEERRISNALRSDLSGLMGGIDIYIANYQAGNVSTKVRVFLKIEVTVLSTIPDSEIKSNISRTLLDSTIFPYGFFYKEDIIKQSLYLSYSDEAPCPAEELRSTKGTFKWPGAYAGDVIHVICPNYTTQAAPFASRACVLEGSVARWQAMNDTICSAVANGGVTPQPTVSGFTPIINYTVNPVITRTPSTGNPVATGTVQDNPSTTASGELTQTTDSNTQVTTGSPEDPSEQSANLISEIQNTKDFTITLMIRFVQTLEKLTTRENLARPSVAKNVLASVSSLVDVEDKILRESEQLMNTSSRILQVIEHIPERVPLTGSPFKEVTKNLAVAAVSVDEKESRDVRMVLSVQPSSKLTEEQIHVDYADSSVSLLPNSTTMTIPTKALIMSLPPNQKKLLDRVAFSVHQSNKLFDTMGGATSAPSGESISSAAVGKGKYTLKVNSNIISASVPGVRVQNLSENITMNFLHSEPNSTNPQCVFWDETVSPYHWSSEGCGVVDTSEERTVCGCNHLTNFALLMDVYQEGLQLSELDRQILSIISYVGCAISLAALLLVLATYTLFRKLRRDNPSKILINLCLALLASNLVYLIGMQDYAFADTTACKAVAVLLHYFLLSSLMWMAVEAFYMYLALVRIFKSYFTHFILKCSLVGWGIPLVIVVITLAVNTTDNYGLLNSGLCWLRNPAFYVAFVGPVCVILFINCLAFAMVIKQLMSMSSSKLNKTDKNSTVHRLRGAVGVVILLGLSWLFAVFAIDQASVVFYYLFAIFNSLQGLFIFIFYCLLKKDAMLSWKRICPCFEEYRDNSKSSSHSRTKSLFTSSTNHVNKNRPSVVTINGTSTSTLPPDSRKNSYFNDVNPETKIDLSDININCRKISFAPGSSDPEYNIPESPVLSEKDTAYLSSTPPMCYEDVMRSGCAYDSVSKDGEASTGAAGGQVIYSNLANAKFVRPDEHRRDFSGGHPGGDRASEHPEHAQREQLIPRGSPELKNVGRDDDGHAPSSRGQRVEGEIDSSHLDPVKVLKLKFERTVSNTSDVEKTNI